MNHRTQRWYVAGSLALLFGGAAAHCDFDADPRESALAALKLLKVLGHGAGDGHARLSACMTAVAGVVQLAGVLPARAVRAAWSEAAVTCEGLAMVACEGQVPAVLACQPVGSGSAASSSGTALLADVGRRPLSHQAGSVTTGSRHRLSLQRPPQ